MFPNIKKTSSQIMDHVKYIEEEILGFSLPPVVITCPI